MAHAPWFVTRMVIIVLAAVIAPPACLWAQASASAGATRTRPEVHEVMDEAGRRVQVPVEVRRIVSLAPSLTETIYALGVQERLVGVTDYCDYPPEALAKPKVGGPLNPSLEQVVALQPDVVLVARTANRRETLEALERLGIAVFATDPVTVEGVLESTLRVASLLGAREQGEALVGALRARLENLRLRLAGRAAKRVLFVVWHEPLISIGRGTFLADALRWAGAELAIETEQDWPRLSLEEVLRAQPEYVVFASSHSERVKRTVDDLRARPGWRNLAALRERRTAVISDAVNRPAPRLVDAIEQLARVLHPSAFAEEPEGRDSKIEIRNSKSESCSKSDRIKPRQEVAQAYSLWLPCPAESDTDWKPVPRPGKGEGQCRC